MRDKLGGMNNSSGPPTGNLRLLVLRVVTVLIFALLLVQVWRLQFLQGAEYAEMADQIRFQELDLPARRGVIYDRNGEILVRNVPSFVVAIVPAELPERYSTFNTPLSPGA